MSKFNFEDLVNELYQDFKETFSKDEIQKTLELGDSYSKDNPTATGKSLLLNHIAFRGENNSDKKINYYQSINVGINIWIADNNKGKSSVFKIIKYALTGNNSLKSDIKSWIDEILLSFKIGNKNYTIYLDKSGSRLKAKLFNIQIKTLDEVDNIEKEPILETKSEKDYVNKIQSFFFNQFSYYSLKWTQKSSKKESHDLLEANTSWKTYFKSIYLESRDSYELIIGEQGKKIFQMLLGLELTYPINRLTIKKDFVKDAKGKKKLTLETQQKQTKSNKKNLEESLVKINKRIEELNKKQNEKSKSNIDVLKLDKEYESLKKERNLIYKQKDDFDKEIKLLKQQRNDFSDNRNKKYKDISLITSSYDKNKKRIIELQEYLEIGIFFSNLDIKHCPSCNHPVKEHKKKVKLVAHKCALCDEDISEMENEIDVEKYKGKIATLENANLQLELDKQTLKKICDELQVQFKDSYNKIVSIERKKGELKDTNAILKRMTEIKSLIDKEVNKPLKTSSEREKLIAEKAVIDFQLNEITKNSIPKKISSDYDNKIKLLESAIDKLLHKRYEIGTNILRRLEDIMLKELREFGLTSITNVYITEKFDVKYEQNEKFVKFSDITEGEQLRAKIALYLSLIQLDIEFNTGRHTRFLMIDSPSKEEGDKKYLEGLSTVLKSIQDRFGEDLQILIGTADRRFINVVKNQYVVPNETFVF